MVERTHLTRRTKRATGIVFAVACLLGGIILGASVGVPRAYAVASTQEYQQKLSEQADLEAQLVGVDHKLADEIIALNDLVDNQIPAAQQAADAAADKAQQAQDVADATSERLDAAEQDKADLLAQIEQTGEDYDDAAQAVANIARSSFHGSDASDVMQVVTDSTTTEDFVNKMQAQSAVTRSETSAADQAANELSTSQNRKQRLDAIEQEIAQLKKQADSEAAEAKQAAHEAREKQAELDSKREQSEEARSSLEQQKSSLTTKSAQEAAQIVAMKAEIDSYAKQVASQSKADPSAGGAQQIGGGSTSSGSGITGGGTASGMDYAVPGGCPSQATFCYGHNTGNTPNNTYAARNCTMWAYLRRQQLSLPIATQMGNATNWANSARNLGYLVNRTPHQGAVLVVNAGQRFVHWYAHVQYGHVAIVERVNADGSLLVSEGGTGFATFPAYETVPSADVSNYQYIHY